MQSKPTQGSIFPSLPLFPNTSEVHLKAPGNYTAMERSTTEHITCTGSTGNAEIALHKAISVHLTF